MSGFVLSNGYKLSWWQSFITVLFCWFAHPMNFSVPRTSLVNFYHCLISTFNYAGKIEVRHPCTFVHRGVAAMEDLFRPSACEVG